MELDIVLLFLSTIVQVVLIAMQTIQIIAERPIPASLCATGVAISNIVAFKIVPSASQDAMLAYIVANAIGVPLAMAMGSRHKDSSNNPTICVAPEMSVSK